MALQDYVKQNAYQLGQNGQATGRYFVNDNQGTSHEITGNADFNSLGVDPTQIQTIDQFNAPRSSGSNFDFSQLGTQATQWMGNQAANTNAQNLVTQSAQGMAQAGFSPTGQPLSGAALPTLDGSGTPNGQPNTATGYANQPQTTTLANGQAPGGLQMGNPNSVYDPTTGKQVSPSEAAFNATKASGTKPPQESGLASGQVKAAVDNVTPGPQANVNLVNQTLQNDPGYQKLLEDAKAAKSVVAQSETLLSQYQKMATAAGISAIDAQLLNTQAIINGTEDDIRHEVQAVSGFATNSQVLALASARNKTLIQNYNNLLATKQMAMDNINTMIGLAGKDRDYAIQAVNQQLQIDQQLNDYAFKFQANAREAYNNVIQAVGYSGLYSSLQDDPQALALAEQTMGFQPGQLQGIVQSQQNQTRLKALQDAGVTTAYANKGGEIQNAQTGYAYTSEADFKAKTGMTLAQAQKQGMVSDYVSPQALDQQYRQGQIQLQQSQLKTDALQRANIASEIRKRSQPTLNTQIVKDANGQNILINSDTGETIKVIGSQNPIDPVTGQPIVSPQQQQQQASSKANIDLISKLVTDKGLNSAVGPNYFARFSLVNQLSGAKSNFIAGVQQLTGQLTLDSLVQAKQQGATFGALSEGELKLLSSSASKLNTWAIKDKNGNVTGYNTDEKDFRAELDKINNFAKLDYILKGGNPADVNVQVMPDGTHWVQNSDGTMTQL